MTRGARLLAGFGSKPMVTETPFSLDIRAATVTYAQVTGPVEFGADWDRSYPVASSTNKRVTGWRFQVNVPQGATVSTATVELTHSQNATWNAPADDLDVGAEQEDTTTAAANEPEAETKGANVGTLIGWSISGARTSGEKFLSPSLASIVQTIINRPSWVANNYMTLWAIHDGGGNDSHQVWAISTEGNKPRLQMSGTYIA